MILNIYVNPDRENVITESSLAFTLNILKHHPELDSGSHKHSYCLHNQKKIYHPGGIFYVNAILTNPQNNNRTLHFAHIHRVPIAPEPLKQNSDFLDDNYSPEAWHKNLALSL